MSLYKQYKTKDEAIWVDYPTEDELIPRFKIARMTKNNKAFNKCMEKETKPYKIQIQRNTISPEKSESIYMSVFCKTILLDWENLIGEDGKLMQFNFENAIKLMTDLPDLYDDLASKASEIGLFLIEEFEASAKN